MKFTTAFISHVPDAVPEEHRCNLETSLYDFYAILVSNQQEALDVCKELVEEEGIQSLILCPGFTHEQIAEISEAVGEDVGVTVARGDGPSSKIAMEAMQEAGWFGDGVKE